MSFHNTVWKDITVPAGTVSETFPLEGAMLVSLILPSTFTTANISFKVAPDKTLVEGGAAPTPTTSLVAVYDDGNNLVQVAAAVASRCYSLSQLALVPGNWYQLNFGASQSALVIKAGVRMIG